MFVCLKTFNPIKASVDGIMNSGVYFGAYTSAFFVCSFPQFPSAEEAPGVRSFSTVGIEGVRAVRGRIGTAWGWPLRYSSGFRLR